MEIKRWVIVVQGFLQQTGTMNGIVRAWYNAHVATSGDPSTRVEILRYNSDVVDLAERIRRLSPENEPPEVVIIAYSWGVAASQRLSYELRRRTIRVKHILSCDGVYKHWHWIGQWRVRVVKYCPDAFPIWIPDNVDRVTSLRQNQSWPTGHVIKAVDEVATKINTRWLKADHQWMDDHYEFHALCKELILTGDIRDVGASVLS